MIVLTIIFIVSIMGWIWHTGMWVSKTKGVVRNAIISAICLAMCTGSFVIGFAHELIKDDNVTRVAVLVNEDENRYDEPIYQEDDSGYYFI